MVEVVLGPSTAPDPTLFKDVAKHWLAVNTDAIETIEMNEEFDELVQFGLGYLSNTQDRGDYRELMSLALLLLGQYPADLGPYHVRAVGGTSNARWMAKVIIEMKMLLFKSQFISFGLISDEDAKEHTAYITFLLKHYVRQWLQCPNPEDAAINDLKLHHELSKVESDSPDYKFASPMLQKLDQHL